MNYLALRSTSHENTHHPLDSNKPCFTHCRRRHPRHSFWTSASTNERHIHARSLFCRRPKRHCPSFGFDFGSRFFNQHPTRHRAKIPHYSIYVYYQHDIERMFSRRHQLSVSLGATAQQGFSFAGKQLNFNDHRSKLFFEFVRALKAIRPKYFLLENVKMKKEYENIISSELGVNPVEINSSLVSAQNRKRLYWTNWSITKPKDKGILLKNIVHENTCSKEQIYDIIKDYIVPFDQTLKILDKEVEKGKVGYFRKDSQANRVYYIHGKAVTLCGDAGGGAAKMGQYLFGCITPDRINKRQNGQRFSDGQKFYTLTAQDRHGVLIEGYVRKLTPTECERLQTLPDGYTEGVSNSQRYKTLGNGWTVDVLAHIFSQIKIQKKEREEQMSNFICPECGINNIDCGKEGYKTPKEIRYEEALREIIINGPSCYNDSDCPAHGGDGFDQGCGHCAVIIAKKALK